MYADVKVAHVVPLMILVVARLVPAYGTRGKQELHHYTILTTIGQVTDYLLCYSRVCVCWLLSKMLLQTTRQW